MNSDTKPLPNFAEHDEDTKNHFLQTPVVPHDFIKRFLDRQRQRRHVPRETLRIVDIGCGRGDTVAWLRAQGWDAYGLDVSPDYVGRGRDYLERVGEDPARLQVRNDDFTYPFTDGMFDVVLSDQVLEHVDDIDAFASEVARISAPGGAGLHIWDAKWRLVESHLRSPLVHWAPKGQARRAAVAAALRVGLAAPYFTDRPFDDRVEIFHRFSEDETFYRPLRATIASIDRHGLRCDARLASRDKIVQRLPSAPRAALPVLGWLYRHLASAILYTHKP